MPCRRSWVCPYGTSLLTATGDFHGGVQVLVEGVRVVGGDFQNRTGAVGDHRGLSFAGAGADPAWSGSPPNRVKGGRGMCGSHVACFSSPDGAADGLRVRQSRARRNCHTAQTKKHRRPTDPCRRLIVEALKSVVSQSIEDWGISALGTKAAKDRAS